MLGADSDSATLLSHVNKNLAHDLQKMFLYMKGKFFSVSNRVMNEVYLQIRHQNFTTTSCNNGVAFAVASFDVCTT